MSLLLYAHQRLLAMQCAGLYPADEKLNTDIEGLLSLIEASSSLSRGRFFIVRCPFKSNIHDAMQFLPVPNFKLAESEEDLFGEKICIYTGALTLTKTLWPCRGVVTLYNPSVCAAGASTFLQVSVKQRNREDLPG